MFEDPAKLYIYNTKNIMYKNVFKKKNRHKKEIERLLKKHKGKSAGVSLQHTGKPRIWKDTKLEGRKES